MNHDITLTFEPEPTGYRGGDKWRIKCTCDRFGHYGLTCPAIIDGENHTRAAAETHAATHPGTTITTQHPPTPGGPLDSPHPLR